MKIAVTPLVLTPFAPFRRLQVVLHGCVKERRRIKLVARVHLGAAGQEALHHLQVAVPGRMVERRGVVVVVVRVHLVAAVQEALRYLGTQRILFKRYSSGAPIRRNKNTTILKPQVSRRICK